MTSDLNAMTGEAMAAVRDAVSKYADNNSSFLHELERRDKKLEITVVFERDTIGGSCRII